MNIPAAITQRNLSELTQKATNEVCLTPEMVISQMELAAAAKRCSVKCTVNFDFSEMKVYLQMRQFAITQVMYQENTFIISW